MTETDDAIDVDAEVASHLGAIGLKVDEVSASELALLRAHVRKQFEGVRRTSRGALDLGHLGTLEHVLEDQSLSDGTRRNLERRRDALLERAAERVERDTATDGLGPRELAALMPRGGGGNGRPSKYRNR